MCSGTHGEGVAYTQLDHEDSLGNDLSPRAVRELAKTWCIRLFEFARAVVPLAVFIVVYCGLVVDHWFASTSVVLGLCCVIVGLAMFKKGLQEGFMPFAEEIGHQLPRKVSDAGMIAITTVLGIVVTFAEPGIDSLQMVAGYLERPRPLLLCMVIEHPLVLLSAIACGVGLAAAVGMMRIRYGWRLLPILLATVPLILLASMLATSRLESIVPLSWDAGAITTGPATVPIVLALGAGLAKEHSEEVRDMAQGSDDMDIAPESNLSGFGVVTLASLYPVLALLCCGCIVDVDHAEGRASTAYYALRQVQRSTDLQDRKLSAVMMSQAFLALRSLLPLVVYLSAVQGLIVREPIKKGARAFVEAVLWCFLGLTVFNIGLEYGSLRLGDEAGQALPTALHLDGYVGGPAAILTFGFVGGVIATFIDLEPCGLGERVEELTSGQITKMQLFLSVALGVGVGVAVGFATILFGFQLKVILLIGYSCAIALSCLCDEGLLCVAWDAAGVTTGPVTVPLVLSVGIGIADSDGKSGGFGMLACASIFPIIAVLILGIVKLGKHEPRWNKSVASPQTCDLLTVT
eukprot:TRINITY_DN28789_c0_g1_i1.p1 TRINITY_DN28789_c0_g1~~TRINITY_DN28789_c0_g1_i1.p1  ORF type:complete len:575 (-),score=72.10 TRINITY_DN28789_c0_g1_i1:327-2051(-)